MLNKMNNGNLSNSDHVKCGDIRQKDMDCLMFSNDTPHANFASVGYESNSPEIGSEVLVG